MQQMYEHVRRDLYYLLKKIYFALKKEDITRLKFLSETTVHNSSIFQDEDSISVAVIAYTLSKIFTLKSLGAPEFEARKEDILLMLKQAIINLKKGRIKEYHTAIADIFKLLKQIEKQFGIFVREVVEQAKIKKGSRVYEHGISLGQVAEIMGISQWELMDYIGNTKAADLKPLITIGIDERLKLARRLFI
ncbi:hypothetical protein HZB88_00625 [archaeon]|nr:hypothetical protein [archaeon]